MKYPLDAQPATRKNPTFRRGKWYKCVHSVTKGVGDFTEGKVYLCAGYDNSLILITNSGHGLETCRLMSLFEEVE
jgi:hypothetical protein